MHGLALCAGIGGLELGLRLALGTGYRAVGYVERDSFAAAVLVARMEEALLDPAPVWDDVATFDGSAWCGKVDCVSAGFPCQPASCAGKRLGPADERWIWPHVERVLRDVGPELVFLENVPPLALRGLDLVLGSLAVLGFDAEWDLFSAAAVGAPHLRERIFILAHRDGPRRARERLRGLLDRERQAQRDHADGRGSAVPDRDCDAQLPQPLPGAGRSRASGAARDRSRVADRFGGQPEERARGQRAGVGQPDGCGAPLADAGDQPAGAEHELQREERPDVAPRGDAMGDTDGASGGAEHARWAGPFPPGLGDPRWAEVPAHAQPALRGVVDGSAVWLDVPDRLRVGGNGVVPLAVAHGLRALAHRAGITVGSMTARVRPELGGGAE